MARGAYHRGLCYAEPQIMAMPTKPDVLDPQPPGESLLERLGFSRDDRVLVIHADDIGLCAPANEGAFETLEDGVASSGSLMVPAPAFPEAAAHARAHRELDLGLHLTLNCEFDIGRFGPISSADQVPTLLDPDGAFRRTALDTATHARPDEVARELRAQIEKALAAGVDVTHLDAHMGTALFPPFLPIYTALAAEYRIPAFAVRPRLDRLKERGLEAALSVFREACERLERAGLPVLDDFDANSLGFGPGAGVDHTRKRLETLRPGVTYWIIHPARGGPGLEGVVGDGAHARAFEHAFYGPGGEFAAWLDQAGIKRVGMRALRDLARSASRSGS